MSIISDGFIDPAIAPEVYVPTKAVLWRYNPPAPHVHWMHTMAPAWLPHQLYYRLYALGTGGEFLEYQQTISPKDVDDADHSDISGRTVTIRIDNLSRAAELKYLRIAVPYDDSHCRLIGYPEITDVRMTHLLP